MIVTTIKMKYNAIKELVKGKHEIKHRNNPAPEPVL